MDLRLVQYLRRAAWAWWRRPVAPLLVAIMLITVVGDVTAQPGYPHRRSSISRNARDVSAGVLPSGGSLRNRLGVQRAEKLLTSSKLADRIRGVQRLAVIGSEEALDALVEATAQGSLVRMNARTRLLAVRGLAPHAGEKEVRKALASVFDSGRSHAAETPLDTLTRQVAALALAKQGGREALRPLVTAIISGGSAAGAAYDALRAYPPKSLDLLLGKKKKKKKKKKTKGKSRKKPRKKKKKKKVKEKKLSHRVVALLGDLGDPRAIATLRRQLKQKDRRLQSAVIVALAKLGDAFPVSMARSWLKKKKKKSEKRPSQRVAATEALVSLGTSDANEAIVELIRKGKTRIAGLRLAYRAPSPALVPALEAVLKAKSPMPVKAMAVAAMARCNNARAARVLLRVLRVPELATAAAFGLAGLRNQTAEQGLEKALAAANTGPPRRLIVRAGIVRFLKLEQSLEGLSTSLQQMLSSKDTADRAVGSFGSAVMGLKPLNELLKSKDEAVVFAAARAALARGPAGIRQLRPLLPAEPNEDRPSLRAVAAGSSLLVDAANVATSALARWSELGGALAPIAAYRFARRDSRVFRDRLKALLGGTDPVVRGHVALGLGYSPERDSVSLLTDAYRFESDVVVRRSIVRALSLRGESRRLATLRLAAELDPDIEVRALARSALAKRRLALPKPPSGKAVAWVTLLANREAERPRVAGRPAVLLRADGLALPMNAAPDGVLIVPGLARAGDVSVRLAPTVVSGDP